MKKQIRYLIQTNLEGGFDIVQDTTSSKIFAHTDSEEAAKEIVRILQSKTNNNGTTSK